MKLFNSLSFNPYIFNLAIWLALHYIGLGALAGVKLKMIEYNGDLKVIIKEVVILLVLCNPMIITGAKEESYYSHDIITLTNLNFEDELRDKALMVMFYDTG